MSCQTQNEIRYCLQDNQYYIVGDNSPTEANGITSKSYYGEIIIPEKYKKKEIREIGERAFTNCISITRVTIFAKLTSINLYAFFGCQNLNYINIPQTVTFIGMNALALNNSAHVTCEFNKGRTKGVYIGTNFFYLVKIFRLFIQALSNRNLKMKIRFL